MSVLAGLAILFALASVICFVAAGLDWGRGIAFGLACAAVVALLLPALEKLPG